MTPDLTVVLGGVVRTLIGDLAPALTTAYASLNAQLMATLLMMVSQEADRAAARLVDENDALLALFAAARSTLTDDQLRTDLQAASGLPPSALTVSALRERNRTLRALLVRLHAHVESLDSPVARELESQIWTELVKSTERRHLDLALA